MRDRVAWAVVLVPVALLTLPGLFVGRAPLEGDLLVYQLPIYEVLSDAVRAGQLPWWDPTVQSGTPFFANVQTQLLWPATWLHAVLPHGPALLIWLLLHGLLAAVGARLWLRGRDLSQSAATLGALVFTLGGPALSMVTKPDKLPAFALVPWLLWGVDRWARGDRVRAAAVGVAADVPRGHGPEAIAAEEHEPLARLATQVVHGHVEQGDGGHVDGFGVAVEAGVIPLKHLQSGLFAEVGQQLIGAVAVEVEEHGAAEFVETAAAPMSC